MIVPSSDIWNVDDVDLPPPLQKAPNQKKSGKQLCLHGFTSVRIHIDVWNVGQAAEVRSIS
jgi:hypothetical protein